MAQRVARIISAFVIIDLKHPSDDLQRSMTNRGLSRENKFPCFKSGVVDLSMETRRRNLLPEMKDHIRPDL